MSKTVYIFSVALEHTTAHYFERAIKSFPGWHCSYVGAGFDLSILDPDDIFLYVDPAPDWPVGLETVPCLTVAYLIDVHQDLTSRVQMSKFFDVVFLAQKDYLRYFPHVLGSQLHWLPLGCAPDIHKRTSPKRDYDVGFVGKLGAEGSRRYEFLTSVLQRYKTNAYTQYYSPDQIGEVYGRSKIVFNVSISGDLNMRFFEAMCAGALLITDRIENGLPELFREDVHYVAYSSLPEAFQKINKYLVDDAARLRISQFAQKAAIKGHTYSHRWQYVSERLATAEKNACARTLSVEALAELYSDIFVSLRKPKAFGAIFKRYAVNARVIRLFLMAACRKLNSCVPLTPNAIRARNWF